MTKVISRYFDRVETARAVRKELLFARRFSQRIIHLFDDAGTMSAPLTAAGVDPATVEVYQKRMAEGGAVLVVKAGFKPLGVARTTREVTAEMGAVDLGDLIEEVEVDDNWDHRLSVMPGQPLLMSRPRDPDQTNFYMANWPIPLISRGRRSNFSLVEPHARMADFPLPLISKRKPFTGSVFSRHARMANFPIPLISKRKPYDNFAFSRHARMANFPLPLISKRKPYTGSIFARHARMANWPFPHLINGKTGTNSLMPGGPRMANFPISLISKRKPYTESIFGRHARMANFPIPLISKRKPFTGSIFDRHARMASFPIPLVVRQSGERSGSGFSFSRLFGIPTISRR